MIRRFVPIACVVLLAACQFAAPVEPIPSPTPARLVQSSAIAGATPILEPPNVPTSRPNPPTSLPVTPTATIQPTTTLTPIPTTTAQPSATPTTENAPPEGEPVIQIDRPLSDEFVTGTIPVSGTITNAVNGTVLLSLRAPDGQPLGPAAVTATINQGAPGLAFTGQVTLELPPTPRQAVMIVQFGPAKGGQPVVEAGQPINVLGRYGRVDRLVVEAPRPFERPAEPVLTVRGVAPGPPTKVLVRLLDVADQVVESAEAELTWYQPGLPCAFRTQLPNNATATQLQVISLGADEVVIETVRVQLGTGG